jgi:hypothetical protein
MATIDGFDVTKSGTGYDILSTYAKCPKDMHVDITKSKSGQYCAKCNYSFWGIKQFGPYQHNGYHETEESALKSLLRSLKEYFNPGFTDTQYCWVPKPSTGFVVLGSGATATIKQFSTQDFT